MVSGYFAPNSQRKPSTEILAQGFVMLHASENVRKFEEERM
jgi:hypothetical protein